jgi:hypothetical protein
MDNLFVIYLFCEDYLDSDSLISSEGSCLSRANSTPPNQKKLKWVIDSDKSGQPQLIRSGKIKVL